MRIGTRVVVKAEWARGLVGTVVAGGVRGRVAVDVGREEPLQVLPSDLDAVEQRPRELKAAEVRAMVSAFFDFSGGREVSKTLRRHRIVRRAEHLTEKQIVTLMLLLEGKALLCTVGGESYAVRRTPIGWGVCGLKADDTEHVVSGGQCSCPDSRFRDPRCKHVEAVENAEIDS